MRNLIAATQREGVGHNYLIEHSAGSGKSNTIGWLAHRLASLHNEDNQPVFDSVVVITDRRVLERQLQDTSYQFEHRQGVVEKIDEDSQQLARALERGVPIIITTFLRLAAVRYKQSFDTYIRAKDYPIKTLVAFSGMVKDDQIADKVYSEEDMNAALDGAVDRFRRLLKDDEDAAELWKKKVVAFRNLYVFLSQILLTRSPWAGART